MKNFICTLILISCAFQFSYAQNSSKKVFTGTSIVWFGLDFSKVKLMDGAGIPYPEEVKTKYALAWNNLFLSEKDKYNLQEFYSKSKVKYDIKGVKEVNSTIDAEELVSYDDYEFDKSTVEEMIKLYPSKNETGIGLVFVVESLSKVENAANTHMTFFDIESREILFHQKMQGQPGGFGQRNFWAGAFYDILKQSKKKWKKWAKGQ